MNIKTALKVSALYLLLVCCVGCKGNGWGRWLSATDTGGVSVAALSSDSTAAYEVPVYTNAAPPSQLLLRTSYTASYNKETRTPNWVGWVLTADHVDGPYARKGHSFAEDTEVPEPRACYSDIRESLCGYQRGHICPAADCKWSRQAQEDAFLMTNICPQNGDLNQRDWKYLEERCRDWAKAYGRIYIVAGPVFSSRRRKTVGDNAVAVPDAFFKVVYAPASAACQQPKTIGFLYENKAGHKDMARYACSVDEVEALLGLDFFHQLDDSLENVIESRYDFSEWP